MTSPTPTVALHVPLIVCHTQMPKQFVVSL